MDWPTDSAWIDDLPDCTLHHLLPLRNPAYVEMKQYLLALDDHSCTFISGPGPGTQHLFTDGSFFLKNPKIASVAAWAVVNASTGAITGHGPVPGLRQSTARAELWALIGGVFTFKYQSWCGAIPSTLSRASMRS